MLVCPNCNIENRIGSIFCRGCGEKLDVSHMRPPKRSERGGPSFWRKLPRRLLALAALGAIVYGGLLIFTPLNLSEESVSPERVDELWNLFEMVGQHHGEVAGREFVIDSAEASALCNRILALDEAAPRGGGGAMVPEKIDLEFLPGNRLRAVIRYRVFGRLTSDTVLAGRLVAPEGSNQVNFEPEHWQLGRLKMRWRFRDLVTGRFEQQFSDRPELDRARSRIQRVQTDRGQARFTIEPPAPPPSVRRHQREDTRDRAPDRTSRDRELKEQPSLHDDRETQPRRSPLDDNRGLGDRPSLRDGGGGLGDRPTL